MTPQEDPFALVRIKSAAPKQNISESVDQTDPFSDVRIKQAEGFPFIPEIGRHAARIGSRIAEGIGGIPGDIESLIQSGVFSGLEKLTGFKVPEEKRTKRELPTTQELKEFSERTTQGFTAPQSEIEKIGDEFTSTAVSLLGPGKFRKALGIAAGAQAAKEGIKIAGFKEGTQEATKLGTMFFLTMLNPRGALKYASNQYEKANSLARGASIAVPALEKNLNNFLVDLRKGVTTPAKNVIIKPTEELLGKITKGKLPVQELTAAKRDLNTLMKDPSLLTREKKLLKVLGKEIDSAIMPYEKVNIPFKKAYRPANEIYGAVMQGTKASDFIKKTLGAKSVLGATLGEAALGHPEYVIPTLGAYVGTIGAARSIDFITRLGKSPELQKYYAKAMAAALIEDSKTLRLYEDKIEEYLQKSGESSRSNQ